MAVNLIIFLLVLGLLIFVHELGHFLVAKLYGITVQEFAFGFPPRLFHKVVRGTRYVLNLIPIGGYVKLLGEETDSQDPSAFSKKPVSIRLAVVVAGVAMNYLLAVVLFAIGFMVGMTPSFSDPQALRGTKLPIVLVGQVFEGSAASQAGLRPGEQLKGFDSAQAVKQFTNDRIGQPVSLELVNEAGQTRTVMVTLGTNPQAPLGVGLYETAVVKLTAPQAVLAGSTEATEAVKFTFAFFGDALVKLFSRGQLPQDLGGPVAIFGVTAQAAAQGLVALIKLVGLLSVNLAVLNIVPFPALDGGKALFLLFEGAARRRVVKQNLEAIIHTVGFILLIALILAVTYRDIIRLQ